MTLLVVASDLPLDPSPGEGRDWLRRELLQPDYRDSDLLDRVLGWLGRVLEDGAEVAERTPPLSLFATMIVVLLLVVALAWLVSRADRGGGRRRTTGSDVVVPGLTADQLRARAETALAEGRHADALVDAFRATATRQVERGRLDDLPGRTAHEVAESMAEHHPERADRVVEVARQFDLALYGERPVGEEQARAALLLDDELSGRRVRTR